MLFLSTLFMVHPRSVQLWKVLPMIEYLQFPWRFLTLVIFAISVLGGGVVVFWKKEKLQAVVAVILGISAVVLNFSFFRVEKTFPMTDTKKLFSAKGWNKLQTDAIFDYLPIFAKAPPGKQAPDRPQIVSGEGSVDNVRKGTNWYQFTSENAKEIRVEVPVYYFPGWKAYVNSKQAVITHDNDLGLIALVLPEGKNEINLKLTDTLVRKTGNILSLFSWFWLFLILFKLRKR